MAAAPERLGRFQLIKRLGRGGMAEVFLAKQEGVAGFSKQLVLKRVLPDLVEDRKFVEMFLDEARLAARLTHPNICQVFELGAVDGNYFIAMEYIAGASLHELLKKANVAHAPMPPGAVLRVVAQLCEALSYAHAVTGDDGKPLELVHRDVTPSNVMITPEGSVKLLDFGIARAADRSHKTQAGFAKGKLGFMSPEQIRSPQDIDRRSDLFALGSVLYTLATGYTPYGDRAKGENGLREMAFGNYRPPREAKPDLAAPIERVILKAMAPERDDRYRNAMEFERDVERAAMELQVSLGPQALVDWVQSLEGDAWSQPTVRQLEPASGEKQLSNETRAHAAPPPRKPADGVQPPGAAASPAPAATSAPSRSLVPLVAGFVALVLLGAGGVWFLQSPAPPPSAPMVAALKRPATAPEPGSEPTLAEPPAVPATPEPSAQPPEAAARHDAGSTSGGPTPGSTAPDVPQVATREFADGGSASEGPTPGSTAPDVPQVATRELADAGAQSTRAPPRPVVKPAPVVTGPKGTLSVTSTPRARVFLDARLLGSTPLKVDAAVGSHRLKLDYSSGTPHQLIINVVEAKETVVRDAAD